MTDHFDTLDLGRRALVACPEATEQEGALLVMASGRRLRVVEDGPDDYRVVFAGIEGVRVASIRDAVGLVIDDPATRGVMLDALWKRDPLASIVADAEGDAVGWRVDVPLVYGRKNLSRASMLDAAIVAALEATCPTKP